MISGTYIPNVSRIRCLDCLTWLEPGAGRCWLRRCAVVAVHLDEVACVRVAAERLARVFGPDRAAAKRELARSTVVGRTLAIVGRLLLPTDGRREFWLEVQRRRPAMFYRRGVAVDVAANALGYDTDDTYLEILLAEIKRADAGLGGEFLTDAEMDAGYAAHVEAQYETG